MRSSQGTLELAIGLRAAGARPEDVLRALQDLGQDEAEALGSIHEAFQDLETTWGLLTGRVGVGGGELAWAGAFVESLGIHPYSLLLSAESPAQAVSWSACTGIPLRPLPSPGGGRFRGRAEGSEAVMGGLGRIGYDTEESLGFVHATRGDLRETWKLVLNLVKGGQGELPWVMGFLVAIGVHPLSLYLSAASNWQADEWGRRIGFEWELFPSPFHVFLSEPGLLQDANLVPLGGLGLVLPEGLPVQFRNCQCAEEFRILLVDTLRMEACPGLKRISEIGWWEADGYPWKNRLALHRLGDLEALPEGLVIPGGAEFHDCERLELPAGLKVQRLSASGLPRVAQIPEDLAVGATACAMADEVGRGEGGALRLTDMPSLVSIAGARPLAVLDIADCPLESIPDGIAAELNIRLARLPNLRADLTRLPAHDLRVEGCPGVGLARSNPLGIDPEGGWELESLALVDCRVARLPWKIEAKEIVLGELPELTELPRVVTVRDGCHLWGLPKVEAMPAELFVAGLLAIHNCPRLGIWSGEARVGRLQLWDLPELQVLPGGLVLQWDLQVRNCPNLRLPAGMVVPRDLELWHYPLEVLPPDLRVGGRLRLKGCRLERMSAELRGRLADRIEVEGGGTPVLRKV